MQLRSYALAAAAMALFGSTAARSQDEAQAAVRDSRLAQAFGSTIVSTYPDGRQAELWLQRDGSYQAEGRRHDRTGGVWQIRQDRAGPKLCLRQRRPFPVPFTYCWNVPQGGLDQPWTSKAFTGERISIRLVRGMYDPAAGDESRDAAKAAGSDKERTPRPGGDS